LRRLFGASHALVCLFALKAYQRAHACRAFIFDATYTADKKQGKSVKFIFSGALKSCIKGMEKVLKKCIKFLLKIQQ